MSNNQEVPGKVVSSTPAPATPAQRLESVSELDLERVKLLTRLLIGATNEGGGYLLDHLRRYQAQVDKLAAQDPRADLDQASRSELVRYLTVGAAVRTQRRMLELTSDGVGLSLRTVRKTTSVLDRLTDNPLGRPLRWPAERLAERLNTEINRSVIVGHQEVVEGSILVREAALDIVDEFIAYISESPELEELVSEQIGQQSIGVAKAVAETSRQISGRADKSVEDTIRGWLGLPPRREMPRSPFVGKPASVAHPGLRDFRDVPVDPAAQE